MNKCNIYIITHKEFFEKYPSNYIPIQVGKDFTHKELGYLSDNTKINISNKNDCYCELTGIYWVWKNCQLSDYIGFCHYRRFFANNNFSKKFITEKKVGKIFEKGYDIILPKKFNVIDTVWNNYFQFGSGKEKDLKKLKKIIKEEYATYLPFFNQIVKKHSASYCNMFIMKKDDFNEYCTWIFDVLEKMEKITDISDYSKSEKRIYGYLSEILLNVWIAKKNMKIKYVKMIRTDENFTNIIKRFIFIPKKIVKICIRNAKNK